MPLLTTTRCLRGWPRLYTTYHQEVEPPYRQCDRALVIRLHRHGIVIGRWTGTVSDETTAIRFALGLTRNGGSSALGDDGALLPHFRRGPDAP
ncbi:hypothetical protein BGM09_01040 [Streptomyces sp. CBMA29]|nr:hypothetical protein [Streptomyces sp. CBMA29]